MQSPTKPPSSVVSKLFEGMPIGRYIWMQVLIFLSVARISLELTCSRAPLVLLFVVYYFGCFADFGLSLELCTPS